MNIFLREVKANFRSLLIWGVVVFMFVWIGFSKFSAYEGNPELLRVLDGIPPAMLEAFSFNTFNLTTITGFFGVMFNYFALMLASAAVMWGADVITKEERDKTVEFSLTMPVRRSKVVTAKTLATLVNCIGLLLITWGAVLLFAQGYETNSEFFRFVGNSMAAIFMLQLIFLAIGVLLGSAMKHYKRAGSLGLSILLTTYVVSVIAGLGKDFENLKYVTPFKYFDPAGLLINQEVPMNFVWLSLGIILVLMVLAYRSYAKRDLMI